MASIPIHPSTAINDRDHGALVKVIAAFCAAMYLLALVARLQIRWPWRSLFGNDDIVAAVATVKFDDAEKWKVLLTIAKAFAVVQMIVVLSGVSKGFGKFPEDLSSAAIDAIKKVRKALALTRPSFLATNCRLDRLRERHLVRSSPVPRQVSGGTPLQTSIRPTKTGASCNGSNDCARCLRSSVHDLGRNSNLQFGAVER